MRRFVGEPRDEANDVRPVGGMRRDHGVVTARRVVAFGKRRQQPAIAKMLGDQRNPAERDALSADAGLHHLIVELEP